MAKFTTNVFINKKDIYNKLEMIRVKKFIGIVEQLKEIGITFATLDRMLTKPGDSVRLGTIRKVLDYIENNKSLLE